MSIFRGVLAVSSTLLLTTGIAHAESYQFNVKGGLSWFDSDYSQGYASAVGGTFFLAPIEDSKGPLAEAAFLSRQPSLGGQLFIGNEDYAQESGILNEDEDIQGYAVAGDFADPNMPLTASLNYAFLETESDNSSYDFKALKLAVGAYFSTNLHGQLYYTTTDDDSTTEEGGGASLRWLGELPSNQFIALEGDIAMPADDLTVSQLLGDFYPTQDLSVGMGIVHAKLDDDNSTGWLLRGRYFFTHQFSVAAQYDRSNDEFDENTFTAQAELRF